MIFRFSNGGGGLTRVRYRLEAFRQTRLVRWCQNLPQWPVLTVFAGLVAAFYFWTASTGVYPFQFETRARIEAHIITADYYNMLTDAFLHGQTSLREAPTKKLLALRDPYDPQQNRWYKLYDAILYRGKYYLSWGPTPALIAFIPFRVLTGTYLPQSLACAFFAVAGFVFSLLLCLGIRKEHFPQSAAWTVPGIACLLAAANMAPPILRRPAVYEVPITCNYFLLSVFLFVIYQGAFRGKMRPRLLLLASALLGLAAGARPHALLAGVVLLAAFWIGWTSPRRPRVTILALCLFAPLAAGIASMAMYNWARFGSPLETGLRFVLTGNEYMPAYRILSGTRLAYSLLSYLFQAPLFSATFPFIVMPRGYSGWIGPLRRLGPLLARNVPNGPYVEPVIGCLVGAPALLVLLFYPAFLRQPGVCSRLRIFTAGCLLAGLVMLVALSASFAPTLRYEMDFLPLLLVPAAVVVLWLDQKARSRLWSRVIFRVPLALLVAYTVLVTTALSITGYDDGLRAGNAAAYDWLDQVTAPLQLRLIGARSPNYGGLRCEVTIPPCEPGTADPLLSSGRTGAADIFFLECLDLPARMVVGWDHWGMPSKFGKTIDVSPGQRALIEIQTPALYPRSVGLFHALYPNADFRQASSTCVVRINGMEVFRESSCALYPTGPDEISTGNSPVGTSTCRAAFRGGIRSKRRMPPFPAP